MDDRRVLEGEALARLRTLVGELIGEDLTSVPFERLLELARDVKLDGGLTIDLEAVAELGQPLLVVRLPDQKPVSSRFNELSPREREVAALIARGLSNKEIASRLFISVATVKDHVHNILRKASLPNRAAIAASFPA